MTDEERAQAAMKDPEIQEILRDPVMQSILQQLGQDPGALRKYVTLTLVHMSNHDCLVTWPTQRSPRRFSASWPLAFCDKISPSTLLPLRLIHNRLGFVLRFSRSAFPATIQLVQSLSTLMNRSCVVYDTAVFL